MKNVNVQALPLRKGKVQRMDIGKVYSVSEDMAEILIKGKKAIRAKDNMRPGEVFELPKETQKEADKKQADASKEAKKGFGGSVKKIIDDITG